MFFLWPLSLHMRQAVSMAGLPPPWFGGGQPFFEMENFYNVLPVGIGGYEGLNSPSGPS